MDRKTTFAPAAGKNEETEELMVNTCAALVAVTAAAASVPDEVELSYAERNRTWLESLVKSAPGTGPAPPL